MVKKYFETDSLKKSEYDKVWLWGDDDCPGRKETLKKFGKSKKDYGIDLVAKKYDGSLCAIQCKCYKDDSNLEEGDVSNFLALASSKYENNKKIFESAVFVWTGKTISDGAALLLENHKCEVLDRSVLKDSAVNWPSLVTGKPKRRDPYKVRDHQKEAINKVIAGFDEHDRGKLVMACGTGKTFATLKIAERQVGKGGAVLYLVPSISLLSQSMREWSEQAAMPHRYVAVCSDTKVGKDSEDASLSELEIRPTTNPTDIAKKLRTDPRHMIVIFSTYQSIMQVSKAQKESGMTFDLVICDEAHRTTGVLKDELVQKDVRIQDTATAAESISGFVAVHQNSNIRSKKRLYVTATPKIYTASSMEKAKKGYGVSTYSMDNMDVYGPEFYSLTFDKAISRGLLSDYKVVIMTVGEDDVAGITQRAAEDDPTLKIPKVAQWVGCWKGLMNPDKEKPRAHPLQRAIAFTQNIANSKRFAHSFADVVGKAGIGGMAAATSVVAHVDGSHDALNRKRKLDWLKESHGAPDECRILSNARCLSEGVDVPALDAVVFLNPKESMIDVIQAVGRVMRKAEGKDYGYVVVPVAVPPKLADPEKALEDTKTYKVVWSVLRALRAHDSKRFEQRMLDGNVLSDIIIWPPPEPCPDCQQGICTRHGKKEGCPDCEAEFEGSGKPCSKHAPRVNAMNIPSHLIHSKIVEKISDRRYLENWAEDVAKIVGRSTARINELYKSNKQIRTELDEFHAGLKKIINDAISYEDAVDMLSQHMVMGRVFDALFKEDNFTEHNPISKTMDRILQSLAAKGLKAEMEDLENFYNDIDARVASIRTHEARQNVIHQLYDKFFNHAFKKTAERLGIVYTPIEIVDFILKSVDYVMRENFNKGLSARNVNIIDPFTGTGSFITRLMSKELNLIQDRDLEYKYKNNLYANEIVLLAYYIAAINCESTFFGRYNQYVPFEGITLVDTFHTKNFDDEWDQGLFTETQKRIEKQRTSNITVVVGNPPYSAGQSNYNDQNQNVSYPIIDGRIKNTYLEKTKLINPKIGLVRSLYDSYIRSIRWASDRIGESGIIGFVTNASFIRSEAAAGVRACLQQEFTDVWVFDLRGNQRTQGEISKKEGGKVFGSGSRAPVAITILVKNPKKSTPGVIHYHDIGDYHDREAKLDIIKTTKSIEGISDWQIIKPDRHHDWIDQRNRDFDKYLPIGSKEARKKKKSEKNPKNYTLFKMYSNGVSTARDVWAYNTSKNELIENMKKHINYCNEYIIKKPTSIDSKSGKWDSELSENLKKFGKQKFSKQKIRQALYRPFFKQSLYFDQIFNPRQGITPIAFPKNDSENLAIVVPDKGAGEKFSSLVTDKTSDLHVIAQSQVFPFKTHSMHLREREQTQYVHNSTIQDPERRIFGVHNQHDARLGSDSSRTGIPDECDEEMMEDNITNYALDEYRSHYGDNTIYKEDIFYYTYGLLHHPTYRKKYANNLTRELPHIPMATDFWTFSKLGKQLADLHLSYETCKRYDLGKPQNKIPDSPRKIRWGRQKKDVVKGMSSQNQHVMIIDDVIVYDNLPVCKYHVNGRTPLEWFVDRYVHTIDKDSGIENWPLEDVSGQDVQAIIERLAYVGVESDRLVSQLPEEFEPDKDWKPKTMTIRDQLEGMVK